MGVERVNFPRLKADLEALGRIGRAPGGGITRPSFSDADMEARRWFQGRLREAGLEPRLDGAGNITARSGDGGGPAVFLGSHLDSVPNGGMFDGALGTLAALEALRVVRERGLRLKRPLELVAFTDEEGAFGGFFGSYAFTGALTPEMVRAQQDVRGLRLADAMARRGLDAMQAPAARRDPAGIHAYLELHIEQGPVLERLRLPIGIVETICGIRRWAVTMRGRADHAGTTPMDARKDALVAAADLVVRAHRLGLEAAPHGRATVGVLRADPGVANIVPERAELILELREQDPAALEALAARGAELAAAAARAWGLEVEIAPLLRIDPVPMAPAVQAAIAGAAQALGLKAHRMPAGAGHDAQVVGRVARAGMVFVACRDGRSHSPLEHADDAACENGANVLLHAALALANE
ncbi:MAG TPA: Zn-dependent hydrolase [Candidatus Sulfotelmatobacter sp.]|nr:Zn-dependent hydrolase [Candidatus Sulfotelmatobacter sp.]